MSENSATDARFPYEHRQNVVVRLCMFLLLEQASVDRCSDALIWALRIPRKLPRCSIHLTT
jgi:hypothetical protein